MNDLIIQFLEFLRINGILSTVCSTAVLILILGIVCYSFYKHKIIPILKMYTDKQNAERAREDEFNRHSNDIDFLKSEYEEIKKNTKETNDKINVLSMMLQDMQNREDAKERARLKSSISRLYRECHATRQWSKIQKDTMEDMIASYEACNGKNSFVHEIVQKEIYTWDIVDD